MPRKHRTTIPAEVSRKAIVSLLTQAGAKDLEYHTDDWYDAIIFRVRDYRHILSVITDATPQEIAYEWRLLSLSVKAKLDLIEAHCSTFEREFFSSMLMPTSNDPMMARLWPIATNIYGREECKRIQAEARRIKAEIEEVDLGSW